MKILAAIGAIAFVVAVLTPVLLFAKVYSGPATSTVLGACRPVLSDSESFD